MANIVLSRESKLRKVQTLQALVDDPSLPEDSRRVYAAELARAKAALGGAEVVVAGPRIPFGGSEEGAAPAGRLDFGGKLQALDPPTTIRGVARGLAAGATAPLRFAGLAVEPGEQSLGARIAQTVGALTPFIAAELATGGGTLALLPAFLRGPALVPRTLRAAGTFGAIEAGAAPDEESRLLAALRGAGTGAAFGATFAPGLTRGGRVAAGAGLSAIFGGPAPVTGTEEEAILLGALLGVVGGGRRPGLPSPEEAVPGRPAPREPVQGELFPTTAFAPPGTQFELPLTGGVPARPGRLPLPETAALGGQLGLPLAEPSQLALPGMARLAEPKRVGAGRNIGTLAKFESAASILADQLAAESNPARIAVLGGRLDKLYTKAASLGLADLIKPALSTRQTAVSLNNPLILYGWHGKFSPEVRKPGLKVVGEPAHLPLHIGTWRAAADRVYELAMPKAMEGALPPDPYIIPLKLTLRKPAGFPDPLSDAQVNTPRFMQRLAEEGYDSAVYLNDIEDPGSLSVAVLDPKVITQLPTQLYLPGFFQRLRDLQISHDIAKDSALDECHAALPETHSAVAVAAGADIVRQRLDGQLTFDFAKGSMRLRTPEGKTIATDLEGLGPAIQEMDAVESAKAMLAEQAPVPAGRPGPLPDLRGLKPQEPIAPLTPQAEPKQLLLNLPEVDQQLKLPLVEAVAAADGKKVHVLPDGYTVEDVNKRIQFFSSLDEAAKAIVTDRPDLPDLTPPDAPNIGGPPGAHPRQPVPGDIPPMPLTDVNLGILPLTSRIRPLKPWAEDVQRRSNGLIPAYTIWKLISRGQVESARFEEPNIDLAKKLIAQVGADRGRAAYYYIGAQDAAAREHAVATFGITTKERAVFEAFHRQFDKLFVDLAVDRFAPYEKNYVPFRGKTAEEVDAVFPRHARPAGFDAWFDHFRRGDISFKEDNLFKLYFQYLRAGSKSRFFEPFYQQAMSMIKQLTDQGAHRTPGISQVYSRLNLLVDEARNVPDQLSKDIVSATDNVLRKLGVDADTRKIGRISDLLLTLNYGANMAFRYSLVLRNLTQSMLSLPYNGPKYWIQGLYEATTAAGKAEAAQAGLHFEPALPYEVEALTRFGQLGAFARRGTAVYRHVDEFNRAAVYLATKRRFQFYGRQLQEGKINLQQYAAKTKLNLYHPIEKLEVLAEARRGNIEGAADLAGKHLHENTQWIYRRGNEPTLFSGTAGRLFGQYGTWPAWYLEYIKRLTRFGSPVERATAIATIIGAYAAMEEVTRQMFGTDISSWIYFGPINYGGGPYLDLASNLASLLSGSEADKEIAVSRLAQFPAQLVPGSGFVRELSRAAAAPTLREAVFTMMGFPPENPYPELPAPTQESTRAAQAPRPRIPFGAAQ